MSPRPSGLARNCGRASSASAILPRQRSDWFWETGPDHRFISVSREKSDGSCRRAAASEMTIWELANDPSRKEPEKWAPSHLRLSTRTPRFRDFRFQGQGFGWLPDSTSPRGGKPVFDPKGNLLGYRGLSPVT